MKLEKLTLEQEKLMIEVRDFWIANSLGGEVDKQKIKEGVEWFYSLAKLKKPKVLIFDSYDALRKKKIKAENSVRASVGASVRASVGASVRDSVRASVGASVRDSVWDSIRDSVRASVWASVWASVGASVGDSVGDSLPWQSGWCAFYDFFERVGIVDNESFRKHKEYLLAGIWESFCFENVAIVLTKPKLVKKDESGRLHSTEDGAIEWRDGYRDYFIHGVKFEKDFWEKVVRKELAFKEILAIENIEQRYAVLSLYNPESLLKEAGGKLIDTGKNGIELYELENMIIGKKLKLLKYSCPSTGRVYVSFVPENIETANEGMAFKFQVTKNEYEILEVES